MPIVLEFSPESVPKKRLEPLLIPLKNGAWPLAEKEPLKGKAKVAFNESVSVTSIPSHADYSETIRSRIWAGRFEISAMAARNSVEFASEGWDWRNVKDDEDMLIIDGNSIHPVHANHFLVEALRRNIAYPKAVIPINDKEPQDVDESEGCYALDPFERPNAPAPDDCDEEEDYDEGEGGYAYVESDRPDGNVIIPCAFLSPIPHTFSY